MPNPSTRLLVEERRRKILDRLHERGRVTVDELVKLFRVSTVTLRGDLQALERDGSLVRSHGGALPRREAEGDMALDVKATLHRAEKARIGRRAAARIQDGDTVILDSGSTTAEVARHLRGAGFGSLTVITNALNIAVGVAKLPQVRLIMLGGVLRPLSFSLVDPRGESLLADLSADKLFLGVDGIDAAAGLTTFDPLEARLNAAMVRAARQVIVVADSSKFGRRGVARIAGLDCVDTVITDRALDPATRKALAKQRVEVVVA
jgi:DeoR family transcriptional regulator, aga operon transcriptional repressor